MRGVRGVRVGALLVALGLMVAACGGGDDEGGDTGTGGDTVEAKKVGLVFDSAGRGESRSTTRPRPGWTRPSRSSATRSR